MRYAGNAKRLQYQANCVTNHTAPFENWQIAHYCDIQCGEQAGRTRIFRNHFYWPLSQASPTAKIKHVPFHSPAVPMLTVQKIGSVAEKEENLATHQLNKEHLAFLAKPTVSNPRPIIVCKQIVLNITCET